jgi:hypothetical protein
MIMNHVERMILYNRIKKVFFVLNETKRGQGKSSPNIEYYEIGGHSDTLLSLFFILL